MTSSQASAEQRFREVVQAHGPALSRLCRGYEVDPVRREELQQDILLALWRALPGFRGDASLRTFVFRVAHNVAIKHARSGARDRSTPGLPEGLADERTDPGVRLDRGRRRAAMEEAIRALDPVDRELVMLHLEGLSNREVAEVSGLSPSNVGTRLSRIRGRLMRHVEVRDVG